MIRRLGGFRRRGFPVLASVSLVTALACGGTITGCGGDDNGGGGGEGDAALDAETGASPDAGTDAAKEAAADSGRDGAPDAPGNPPPDAALDAPGNPPPDAALDAPGNPPPDAALDAPGNPPPDSSVVDSGPKDGGPGTTDGTVPTEGGPEGGPGTTDGGTGDAASTAPLASFPTSTIGLGLGDCGGAAITTNLIVKNNGGGTLTVTVPTIAGNVFAVTPSNLSLTAGQSGTLTVTATVPVNSTAAATLSGSLTVTTNDATHANTTIPLTAIAHGATLAWATGSPANADFGIAPNGVADTPIALTLTNTGNAPATAVTFGAVTNAQFSLTPLTLGTLAPNATAALSAGFTPNVLSLTPASSSISSTGAICGTSLTSLAFIGQGGFGAVSGWPSGPIDFHGGACGGAAPAAQSFLLTNGGTIAAHIASVTPGGTTAYTTDIQAGATIAPNGGTLTVNITPPAIPLVSAVPGDYSGTVTFTTDVSGDSPHTVSLTEHAVGAILSFDISPTGDTFGSFGPVADGTAPPQNFNVVNSGNLASDVTLTTTTPFSVGSAVFSVVGDPAQPFADTVTFSPTTPGGATSHLVIVGDNLCQPVPGAITLSGIGEGGGISISTQSLAFAADCGTAAAPQTFTITNTGNQPMMWTAAGFDATLYALSITTATLAAGETSTVTVTPVAIPNFPSNTAPSAFASAISITTNIAGDITHTISLSETPHGDVLTLVSSPNPLDFGKAPINTVSQGPTFTIANAANAGSTPASVSIGLSGDNPGNFTLASTSVTVGPGTPGTPIGVAFDAPGAQGSSDAVLSIGTPLGEVLCAPLPAALPVTGVATEAGPHVSPTALGFGDDANLVNCGGTAPANSVTVTNTGTQDFTITGISVNNTIFYGVAMSPADGIVHVNPPNSVTITVTPAAIPANVPVVPAFGTFDGLLTITTDANVPFPVLTVPLTMGAKGAIVTGGLSTTNWTFGNVSEFTGSGSSTFSAPITNTGNEPLQITMTNSNPVFTLTPSPSVVNASSTIQLTATFTPSTQNASSTDIGLLNLVPTVGNVFCEPVPASWAQSLSLSGSSTNTFF